MVAQLETTSEAAEAEAPVAPPEAAGDDDASGLGSQVVAPPVSLKDVSSVCVSVRLVVGVFVWHEVEHWPCSCAWLHLPAVAAR